MTIQRIALCCALAVLPALAAAQVQIKNYPNDVQSAYRDFKACKSAADGDAQASLDALSEMETREAVHACAVKYCAAERKAMSERRMEGLRPLCKANRAK